MLQVHLVSVRFARYMSTARYMRFARYMSSVSEPEVQTRRARARFQGCVQHRSDLAGRPPVLLEKNSVRKSDSETHKRAASRSLGRGVLKGEEA